MSVEKIGDVTNIVNDLRNVAQNIINGTADGGDFGASMAAVGSILSVYANSPIFTSMVAAANTLQIASEYSKFLAAQRNNDQSAMVEATLSMLGSIGGLIALAPTPQTKIIGIAIAISASAAKDLYKNEGLRDAFREKIQEIASAEPKPWPYDPTAIGDDFLRRYPGAGGLNNRIPVKIPYYWDRVDPNSRRSYEQGINWRQPSDPLVLDLDNDGIELTPSSSAVLFDHNADTIKTGSQWVKPDDAILVRDLNGNGLIDSGRELFGDQTQITTTNAQGQIFTTLAANGFAALKPLDKDANGLADGSFNASDIAYADLKLWRDLNQDGISQSNELLGLAEETLGSGLEL